MRAEESILARPSPAQPFTYCCDLKTLDLDAGRRPLGQGSKQRYGDVRGYLVDAETNLCGAPCQGPDCSFRRADAGMCPKLGERRRFEPSSSPSLNVMDRHYDQEEL
jgi:hypothetical protein